MPVIRRINDHDVEFSTDDISVEPEPGFKRGRRRPRKTWGWECDCPVEKHGFISLDFAIGNAEGWHTVEVS